MSRRAHLSPYATGSSSSLELAPHLNESGTRRGNTFRSNSVKLNSVRGRGHARATSYGCRTPFKGAANASEGSGRESPAAAYSSCDTFPYKAVSLHSCPVRLCQVASSSAADTSARIAPRLTASSCSTPRGKTYSSMALRAMGVPQRTTLLTTAPSCWNDRPNVDAGESNVDPPAPPVSSGQRRQSTSVEVRGGRESCSDLPTSVHCTPSFAGPDSPVIVGTSSPCVGREASAHGLPSSDRSSAPGCSSCVSLTQSQPSTEDRASKPWLQSPSVRGILRCGAGGKRRAGRGRRVHFSEQHPNASDAWLGKEDGDGHRCRGFGRIGLQTVLEASPEAVVAAKARGAMISLTHNGQDIDIGATMVLRTESQEAVPASSSCNMCPARGGSEGRWVEDSQWFNEQFGLSPHRTGAPDTKDYSFEPAVGTADRPVLRSAPLTEALNAAGSRQSFSSPLSGQAITECYPRQPVRKSPLIDTVPSLSAPVLGGAMSSPGVVGAPKWTAECCSSATDSISTPIRQPYVVNLSPGERRLMRALVTVNQRKMNHEGGNLSTSQCAHILNCSTPDKQVTEAEKYMQVTGANELCRSLPSSEMSSQRRGCVELAESVHNLQASNFPIGLCTEGDNTELENTVSSCEEGPRVDVPQPTPHSHFPMSSALP